MRLVLAGRNCGCGARCPDPGFPQHRRRHRHLTRGTGSTGPAAAAAAAAYPAIMLGSAHGCPGWWCTLWLGNKKGRGRGTVPRYLQPLQAHVRAKVPAPAGHVNHRSRLNFTESTLTRPTEGPLEGARRYLGSHHIILAPGQLDRVPSHSSCACPAAFELTLGRNPSRYKNPPHDPQSVPSGLQGLHSRYPQALQTPRTKR